MDTEFGAYQITTTIHEAASGDRITVGETLRGLVTQKSPYHPTRYTQVEYITLEVTEQQEVQIEVRETEYVAFLVLEDEWGSVVAETEYLGYYDYSTGPRRIRHDLAPGTYRIGVGSSSHGLVGPFTLQVRSAAPSSQQG
jgi:hypothetical protein